MPISGCSGAINGGLLFMKNIILTLFLLLSFIACSNKDCKKMTREYQVRQRVKVIDGQHKGKAGFILSFYVNNGYFVRLDTGEIEKFYIPLEKE